MTEIIEEVNALEPAMAADPNDLIVRDGPLTQPFMDYVFDTGRIKLDMIPWFNYIQLKVGTFKSRC